ncbi:DUF2147 domain-containing protein [Spirosoma oryzicola]|uniref:DUF2147 domain-containing protein n=1 Tax=Spirosoma oryzicola TaxID=2898794 RepID=UPI001E34ACDD|nr:DUF2147 domain-containing protein [Spirosoma oryzicola]UHG93745.1 DUF2147 domain-containing protein [Spirosoma oryzicola]
MHQVEGRYRSWSLLIVLFLLSAVVDQPADQLIGRWQFPSKGSSVDVYRQAGLYFARVAEVDQAGEQNFGLVKDSLLIRNLQYDGELWSKGRLIHPKTGIALNVEIAMVKPNTITVTVYKGLKLFHRKFEMTRQEKK